MKRPQSNCTLQTVTKLLLIVAVCWRWAHGLNPDQCSSDLGMETELIPDSAITASSQLGDDYKAAYGRVRVDRGAGGWCPAADVDSSSYEYLQIDLGVLKVITRTETQGRFNAGQGRGFVEHFRLEYQRENGGLWFTYRDVNNRELLTGNVNSHSPEMQVVNPPIIARRIRFVPVSTSPKAICLRVELYGCDWPDHLVSYSIPQGHSRGKVEFKDFRYDGKVQDDQLTGGLGQLTDGYLGAANFKVDPINTGYPGYDWIGWQKDEMFGKPVQLVFKFDSARNFTEVMFHCNNMYQKEVAVFGQALVYFSMDGQTYSSEDYIEYRYSRDEVSQIARNVTIPLNHRIGQYLKVQLHFDTKWILISEVRFKSDAVPDLSTTVAAFLSILSSSMTPTTTTLVPSTTTTAASNVVDQKPGDDIGMDKREMTTQQTAPRNRNTTLGTVVNDLVDSPSTLPSVVAKSQPAALSEVQLAMIISALFVLIILIVVMVLLICWCRRRSKHNRCNGNTVHADCIRNFDGRTYGYDKSNGLYCQDAGRLASCCSNMNTSSTYSDLPDTGSLRRIHRKDCPKSPANSDTYAAVPDIMQSALMNSPDDPRIALLPYPHEPAFPLHHYPNGTLGTISGHLDDPHPFMYLSSARPPPPSIPIPPPPPSGFPVFLGPYASADVTSTSGTIGRPHSVASIQGVTGASMYAYSSWANMGLPEIPHSQLQYKQKIGSGHFGEVHLATTKGPSLSGRSSVTSFLAHGESLVAVKTLKPTADQRTRDEFERETRLTAQLRDPNIVQVLGVCPATESQPLGIVLEYMRYGDLYQFLRDSYTQTNNVPLLSTVCLTHMAAQIASGMKFLEARNMVHRDLATRNCLVGPRYTVKIGDFGMSRRLFSSDYYRMEGQAMMPIRWMAWESIVYSKFSPRSDVWSFGVTVWEIFTFAQEQPFSGLSDQQVIDNATHHLSQDGQAVFLRPPQMCPSEMYDLMYQCWQRDNVHRPPFIDIHAFLQQRCKNVSLGDSELDSDSDVDERTPVNV